MLADAFVAHVVVLGEESASRAHATDWWTACQKVLGLTETFSPVATPIEDVEQDRPAAVRSPTSDAIEEAVVRRLRDGFCVSILLAPTASTPWERRFAAWRAMADDLPRPAELAVSHTVVLLARSADDEAPPEWPHLGEPVVTAPGVTVREVASDDDGRVLRQWLVLGGIDDEAAVAGWAWSAGQWSAPPLVGYLVPATVVRHRLRQWREQRSTFLASCAEADDEVDALVALLATDADTESLSEGARHLRLLQSQRTGLVQQGTRLRQQAAAVRAMADNLVLHATPLGPVADDQALAAWLAVQLDDDAAWLSEVRERADHVALLADQQVSRAEVERQDVVRRRQERLNIGLTAVTGAILTALTAVQALQLVVGISDEAKVAVTVLLATITLVAGLAVLRLARPDRIWPVVLLRVGLAGLGAAAAAVVVAFVPDANAATTWAWSGVAFLVGLVAGVATRSFRERSPSQV